MNKVFGIGLGKTGTTSLANALRKLGYKIADYPRDPRTLEQLRSGDYDLDVVRANDGMTDTPAALCYQQLDAQFPNSKFILTVRPDREKWLKSCESEWLIAEQWVRVAPQYREFRAFIDGAVYGLTGFNAARYSMVFDRHYSEVLDYFDSRSEDLLIFDVTAGHGWKELCDFLELPVPEAEFPHSNGKHEKPLRYALIESIPPICDVVGKFIPQGSTIGIIDDDGLRNTLVGDQWRCEPLTIHENGLVGGNPSDDAHAIKCLELAKDRGLEALLLWKKGSDWWHDAYPGWSKKLSDDFEMMAENEDVALYRV